MSTLSLYFGENLEYKDNVVNILVEYSVEI